MLTKMQDIVLSYPKLRERIHNREEPKKEQEKALKNLDEIRADFSPAAIKSFQRFLDTTMHKLYDSINFDDTHADIKSLLKDNCVVLVPNHQSHADYLAINYLFYKTYKVPLYVAGGVNLDIFPIGKLFRKSGCFFIRRSFANDVTYKLTLEAYLYYLLKMGRPIEFFFEGGRSRTGKLLPPRYGLYGMLLDAHRALSQERKTPLLFIPVSIVHEYVPEQKSLAKELGGAKKKKESTGQLLGLFKLFAYQFGSIHMRLGKPVEVQAEVLSEIEEGEELKKYTQDLAFKCFREVGRGMMVTPTSLLAMVLLDEPSGAMLWQDIFTKAQAILDYCEKFNVPKTENLNHEKSGESLERAMDILIGNGKVDVIGRESHGSLYYSIREESRTEILYFKNTIVHHFLIPAIIGDAWINLFSGQINDVKDLKEFFLFQRRSLKYEFYLPTVKEFFYGTLKVVSDCIGRRVGTLEDLMNLGHKELYAIASTVGLFNRALTYIMEAYLVAGRAIYTLSQKYPDGFKIDDYNKMVKELHEEERKLGRLIRYPESYSIPLTKTALKYYSHSGTVENSLGTIKVTRTEDFEKIYKRIEKNLNDLMTISIRAVKH